MEKYHRKTCLSDINECNTETDNCDVNAKCTNTDGSFTCTCNKGYTGDGETCTGMLFVTFQFLFFYNYRFVILSKSVLLDSNLILYVMTIYFETMTVWTQ